MAGIKETPRQKLISLMYLVLLAMLALQVSAAIVQKFEFLNDSLAKSTNEIEANNLNVLTLIDAAVEQNKKSPDDMRLQKIAQDIHLETKSLSQNIEDLKQKIINESGGRDEFGRMVGASEEEIVANMMLGTGDRKNGEAYALKKLIDDYTKKVNQLCRENKLAKSYTTLAADGKEDSYFRNDPDQNFKDFAHLNFESTPVVAAISVLTDKQNKLNAIEQEILAEISSRLGSEIIPVNRVRPIVMNNSNKVVAGTEYNAQMFMAAYSTNFSPKMTFNKDAIVANKEGVGEVSFRASGGDYDEKGLLKKTWKGTITYPKPSGGDSTYEILHDYYVVKPVIEFKTTTVSRMYRNAENAMTVAVPALGTDYNPEFKVRNAKLIKKGAKGNVQIAPISKKNVELEVYNNGVFIGKQVFRVSDIPLPELDLIVDNRKVDPVQGIRKDKITRLKMKVSCDSEFANMNPHDTYFKPDESEVLLVRNGRVRSKGTLNNLAEIKRNAQVGDNLVVELKSLKHKNFLGEEEEIVLKNKIFVVSVN